MALGVVCTMWADGVGGVGLVVISADSVGFVGIVRGFKKKLIKCG